MREVVQYLLPAPYVLPASDKKTKGVKPLMSERQIEELVQGALIKDADVSRINVTFDDFLNGFFSFVFFVNRLV